MPELPEVETIRRGLGPALEGRVIRRVTLRRADLRIPFDPDFVGRLEGRRILDLKRRAKYLLAGCDDETVLLMHLGMSGRLTLSPARANEMPGAHDHVVLETDIGTRVTFSDPRRFGLMALTTRADLAKHPLLCHLGLEPLDPAFTAEALLGRLAGRRTPLKAALLDQRLIAGLGNIYVCEALFRAGLSPRRLATNVTPVQAQRLAAAIGAVLEEAIAAGGSSLRDYAHADGSLGYFQHAFKVYGRDGEQCSNPGCSVKIRRTAQAGRSTFYCPRCQR